MSAPMGRELSISLDDDGNTVFQVAWVVPIGQVTGRELRPGQEITVRVNNLTPTRVVFVHAVERDGRLVLVCHSVGRPDDPVEVGPHAVVTIHRTRTPDSPAPEAPGEDGPNVLP